MMMAKVLQFWTLTSKHDEGILRGGEVDQKNINHQLCSKMKLIVRYPLSLYLDFASWQ